MKLTNGQTNLEYDFPSIEIMMGEAVEKYRGQNRGQGRNYLYVRHIPVPQHPPQVRCCSVRAQIAEEKETDTAVRKKSVKQQNVFMDQPKNNIAEVHRTNLCDILERRCRAAEAKGDEKLLSLLEVEWQYMVC